jgi:hypothetical protein
MAEPPLDPAQSGFIGDAWTKQHKRIAWELLKLADISSKGELR